MKPSQLFRYRHTLVIALVLFVASIATFNPLDIFAQEKRDCPVRVTLLQLNDVYQFAPVDGGKNGGLGRVLTWRKKIAAESPHTPFLFAGHTNSPSLASNNYK